VLARHFIYKAALAAGRKVTGVSPDALQSLESYNWPGNVRQLEWAMERAVVLGESEQVELRDLPPAILEPVAAEGAQSAASAPVPGLQPIIAEETWEQHEKAKIVEALDRTNWNITRAAQLLGMTFRTLQYRVEKFGLKRP
ncbi:MAG: helix-turn-helix domain-containing protein, partial [Deltaproteobacteria bacterium]